MRHWQTTITHEDVSLTAEDIRIIELVVHGLSRAQIAERLCVTHHAVNYHLTNAYLRLGVNNKIQAVNEARRLGFLKEETCSCKR